MDNRRPRRLSVLLQAYVYFRMLRIAYRVTRRGLSHPVLPGDKIHLQLKFTIEVDDEKWTIHV